MDYQANSRKAREAAEKPKEIEKVVSNEVRIHKKPLGVRVKETFLGGDARSVGMYILGDVLLPAFRNLLVDATTKGIERMVYGEQNAPRRPQSYGPRITYNTPVRRVYQEEPRYRANLPDQPSYSAYSHRDVSELILQTREEAELVLERLQDIIDGYDVASLSDLRQLVGQQTTHVDNKWGWVSLRGATIRHIRDGFLLILPPVEPI